MPHVFECKATRYNTINTQGPNAMQDFVSHPPY